MNWCKLSTWAGLLGGVTRNNNKRICLELSLSSGGGYWLGVQGVPVHTVC
jgi:hypothetical protein